jgi:hypothetical protein
VAKKQKAAGDAVTLRLRCAVGGVGGAGHAQAQGRDDNGKTGERWGRKRGGSGRRGWGGNLLAARRLGRSRGTSAVGPARVSGGSRWQGNSGEAASSSDDAGSCGWGDGGEHALGRGGNPRDDESIYSRRVITQ